MMMTTRKIDTPLLIMPVVEELKTFSAFQGKVSGNTIAGVSLIQEGPALGHGVFVDRRALNKFRALAMEKGRVKAKLNHFSSVQDTIGYYENFRVAKGKLLADLTLFEAHSGKDMLLEMINEIPSAFGVSLMFAADEPELDKASGNYMTRPRGLYSADFVDTPAANADGVFSADEIEIDNEQPDIDTPMPTSTQETQIDFSAKMEEQAAAFAAKFEELVTQFAEENGKVLAECAALKTEIQALQEARVEAAAEAKLLAAAPPIASFSAPINEPEVKGPSISYHEAKNQAIGTATGLDRLKAVRAFMEKFPTETQYVAANS